MLSSVAARGGQSAARAAQRVSVLVASPPLASSARRAATPSTAGARRSMGGHARNIGLPGEHVPIEVGKLHKTLGTVYMTTMFLWMMYRAKEDGLVLLVSLIGLLRIFGCALCLSVCFGRGVLDVHDREYSYFYREVRSGPFHLCRTMCGACWYIGRSPSGNRIHRSRRL